MLDEVIAIEFGFVITSCFICVVLLARTSLVDAPCKNYGANLLIYLQASIKLWSMFISKAYCTLRCRLVFASEEVYSDVNEVA